MQVQAELQVPVTSGWPNILPGPFILLLLLPAIPLVLFSFGARPPDTNNLPFTTDDLWQTTAFVTVAGSVVLAMGVYPGLLGDITGWIKDGEQWGVYLPEWTPSGPRASPENIQQDDKHDLRPKTLAPRVQEQIRVRYEDVPRVPGRVEYRPESYRRNVNGQVYHRPAGNMIIPGSGGGKRAIYETVTVVAPPTSESPFSPLTRDPASHNALSSIHLTHLRESPLTPWYCPGRPYLPVGAIALIVAIILLIGATTKVLRPAYKSDTSARKAASKGEDVDAWHIRELSKRKKESEKETIERNKAQEASFIGRLKKMDGATREKELKKKKKELEALKKELQKRKMPLVALDWDLGVNDKDKGREKYKDKGKDRDKAKDKGKVKGKDKGQAKSNDKSEPSKLKKLLLGPLASGSAQGPKSDLPSSGPGWKPADDAVAHAAIRGGAIRAESMANSLVAQKQ